MKQEGQDKFDDQKEKKDAAEMLEQSEGGEKGGRRVPHERLVKGGGGTC